MAVRFTGKNVVVDRSRTEDIGESRNSPGAVAMKRSESELILEKFLGISSSSINDDKGVSSSSSPGNRDVKEQTDEKADYKVSISKLPGSAIAIDLLGCLDSGITGTPLSPCKPKSSDTHIWTATSDSSRDLSDDEDVDIEVGPCGQSMNPFEVKRIRRMVSNRESARRSRKRKQAHLVDLETQVDHLRSENSILCKQLTDITQQCDRAATHNKILKSDMEVLRASVKMAQDMVTRGPLSDIVNHHSLRSDFASSFRSLCRPLDIPAFVGNDGFLGISSLPDMPSIGVETEILDVKAKLESHINIEHLEAWNWDVSAPMKDI